MTAHCNPKQMPKNGILASRTWRIAASLPAMPVAETAGTSSPSTRQRCSLLAAHVLGLKRRISTLAFKAIPAWMSDS